MVDMVTTFTSAVSLNDLSQNVPSKKILNYYSIFTMGEKI